MSGRSTLCKPKLQQGKNWLLSNRNKRIQNVSRIRQSVAPNSYCESKWGFPKSEC
nr:MAG TPA: hypothetical protein [Caudoviricetes sp.]